MIMAKFSTILIVILLNSFVRYACAARQYLYEDIDFKIPANALCSSLYQTTLATITSLDDQIAAERLLISLGKATSAWMGLNDITTERGQNKLGWQFLSGATQVVEFWATSNPKGVADDDCVAFNMGSQTGVRIPWESFACNARAPYFCDDAINPRYKAILDQSLSYLDAEQFCRNNFQTGLATVRNSAEQDYLKRLIAGFDAWIGFNDQRVEGQFIWTSGLPVTFTNITNFSGGNAENCVEVVGLKTSRIEGITFGTWRDADCAVAKPFLCDNNFVAFVGGANGQVPPPTTSSPTTAKPTTSVPTTAKPTTSAPTTAKPTTSTPTTSAPTTLAPTTSVPTTAKPTTSAPTTAKPTTSTPTTSTPTTSAPTTSSPTTSTPTTSVPTTAKPTTSAPTTSSPTTSAPTTSSPTTSVPTTSTPTTSTPTTSAPTTSAPTTSSPTTSTPTTSAPTTSTPTTSSPTTSAPTTAKPTTSAPTTSSPTTFTPTTFAPTTAKPTTSTPTTSTPSTSSPTTQIPITSQPSTASPVRNDSQENNSAILIGGASAAGAVFVLAVVGVYRRRRMLSSDNKRNKALGKDPEAQLVVGMTPRHYWHQSAKTVYIPQPTITEEVYSSRPTYYDMANPPMITMPPPGLSQSLAISATPPPGLFQPSNRRAPPPSGF